MTPEAFRAKRRQKFLTEKYFKLNLEALRLLTQASLDSIHERAGDHSHQSSGQDSVFEDKLNLLKLYYTAGRSIEELRPLFADVMTALGEWHVAEHEYSKWLAADSGKDLRVDMTPVHFEDLFHFQLAIDVVSLAVLLGDGEALRQIAVWMSSARGTDMLFEYLISPAVSDPLDNTDFFHTQPYDSLIDAFYTAETPEESSAFVKKYLEGWYKSFEGMPWHNGHLKATAEYIPYYGYWSFEAAAVCLIHGIDDSRFRNHLIYPKDLADWARANQSLSRLKPGATTQTPDSVPRLRCESGQPCPREGWWFTPASVDSRRRFAFGELMPELGGDYGATIWQWDEQQ
jgi:Domain of unknown function (DUF1911)/Domain of unknown function (DUF1910)